MAQSRLYAQINDPFLVAVQTDPGATVDVQVTNPDLTAGPLLSLDDSDGDGVYRATFTPTDIGDYQLTIQATGTPVDGLAAILEVSSTGAGYVGGVTYSVGSCEPGGENLRWPCPNLASLPCITSWSADQIARWSTIATATMYEDLCRRFPGCDSYAKLRPRAGAQSLCRVPSGSYGIDLWPTLRYPAVEICEIEIDGTALADTTGWRIDGKRYLVPEDGTSWPSQDLDLSDGSLGTWSVLVRYGRPPPPLAVEARDRWMLAMLTSSEPTSSGDLACSLPDGTVSLSEGGRTIQFDPGPAASALHDQAMRRWRCRPLHNRSQMIDPAEHSAVNGGQIVVVAGDHTPAAAQAFFPSGCDLDAQLAALTA